MRKTSASYEVFFSLSIEYLKEHCLKTINDKGFLPKPENIKFVLTVPAIWNDISKQFMRNAAIKVWLKSMPKNISNVVIDKFCNSLKQNVSYVFLYIYLGWNWEIPTSISIRTRGSIYILPKRITGKIENRGCTKQAKKSKNKIFGCRYWRYL